MIGTGNLTEGSIRVNQAELLSALSSLCRQHLADPSGRETSHHIELGLTETGQFLKQMVKLAGVGCWIWDEVGERCIYCSDELAKMNDLSVQQYYAERGGFEASIEKIHPEDQTHYYRSISKAYELKQPYSVEFRKFVADDNLRILRERGEPLIDANDELVFTVGICEDITETRQLEEELRDRETWFRELFEDSPVSLWVEDWSKLKTTLDTLAREGGQDLRAYFKDHPDRLIAAYDEPLRIDFSQETLRCYHAATKQELMAISGSGHADPEELVGFLDQIASLYEGAPRFEYEAQETACDGSVIFNRIRTVIPQRYRDTWSRVLISVVDKADQKISEEETLRLRELHAAGQIVASSAHRFNIEMAGIKGKAEIIAGAIGGDSEVARHIEGITRGCDQVTDLTNELIDLAGKLSLLPQPIDLDNIVVETKNEMLRSRLEEKVEIEEWPTLASWNVFAEPAQVENVILTLAINTRAAMPRGGKLRVTIENVSIAREFGADQGRMRPGDYVVLIMKHRGETMPTEISDDAFEPYLAPSSLREYSGLGLAMVYGYAQQLGGHVTMESEQDCGLTVRLYVPRYDSKHE